MRNQNLKSKARFSKRDCRSCGGSGCEVCIDGIFQAKLKPDWEPPEIPDGFTAVAVLDFNYWEFVGLVNDTMDEQIEIDFPFAGSWADVEDFQWLGFKVQTT